MSIQSIKSEICQLLNIESISASEAKQLPQASNISGNWSKTETWEQLLENIKSTQSATESPTTADKLNNDVSTLKPVEAVIEPPTSLGLKLNLNLGITKPQLIEDKEIKALNLKERAKRAKLYSALTDSGEVLINAKVKKIKQSTLTALEKYEQLLKTEGQKKLNTKAIVFYYHINSVICIYVLTVEQNTTEEQLEERFKVLEAKEKELKEKEKLQIASLTKQSNIDARLQTTISAEISKINFKQIAVRRQRRILEDSGMAFNINTDLRQTFKALWKVLEDVEISDEVTSRLLIQQHEDSYSNSIYRYIYANLSNKVKQQFATKFNFNAPLNIIRNAAAIKQHETGTTTETILNLSKQTTFNLTRQDDNEFSKYLTTIEYIEAKNKEDRTEDETDLLAVHKEASETALAHLISNYTVDIQQITLKQWLSICLDNLGIEADKSKSKGRMDVYTDTIEELEIKRNPLAVIAHLIYENVYSNDVVEISELNPDSLAVIDRYSVTRTINEFQSQYPQYLLAQLIHSYGELHSSIKLEHKHEVWFNKKLAANRKIVKSWLLANPTYRPKKLKDDFRKLYSLITKCCDYKPSNLNIADEVLKQSYRPVNTLEVMALPASLTSHFEGKEQLGDKYKKSPVAQGKMRVSAINDRSFNNLLPNIPLYCRQKLGDIIVVLKESPVENRLIDIVWCDKSTLDKGGKELTFNPIGSLTSKKIQGKHVLICKLVPKFITLASKHNCGNGTTALYFVLAALDNWGLKDNHPVSYNPLKHIEIAEIKEAEQIFAHTDNEKLEKYLADRYELGKNLKFIPIWSELIANHFNLEMTPIEIDGRNYIEVIDKRQIREINNFKRSNPQAKQIANNPVSRLVYQVAHNSSLDKLDDKEEIVSKKREITAAEYYSLLAANNALEADEVVLEDRSILRRVKQVKSYPNRIVEEIVTGLDNKGKPIIEKRVVKEEITKVDAGYKYYLVNKRRINTWHY